MSVWYDRDLIAERDSKNKLHNAVIKWWQVNYANQSSKEDVPVDTVEASDVSDADEESMKLAEEIYARLNAEKAADDAVLQAQIDEAFAQAAAAEAARTEEANYNATTGAYSGAYGMNAVLDKDGQSRVDSIMGEKEAALRTLIEGAQN
jgi:hypothetical protein